MATREELELVLEVITEGKRADIPEERRRALFGDAAEQTMEALRRDAEKWIGSRSVQGLEVGHKTKGGRQTDELAIVVLVDRKRPRNKIRNPIPRRIKFPRIGDVPTDVVAVGKVRAEEFTARVRPAMPGCSIGHHALVTYGTFGLLVRRQQRRDGATFILSNSHVLALGGLASVGDDIIQPGPGDVDGLDGTIARLEQWVPFDFDKHHWPNLVDAAIARVVRADAVTNVIRKIDVAPAGVSTVLGKDMYVHKVGRTTDSTSAKIVTTKSLVKVPYMTPSGSMGTARFKDQVRCEPYSSPGDSGSAVLNANNEVVGLHFAGSAQASWFSKIGHVFAALGIELA